MTAEWVALQFVKSYLVSAQDFWLRNIRYYLKYLGYFHWENLKHIVIYCICLQKGNFVILTDGTICSAASMKGGSLCLTKALLNFSIFILRQLLWPQAAEASSSKGAMQSWLIKQFYPVSYQCPCDWGRNAAEHTSWFFQDHKWIQYHRMEIS